MKKHNHVVAVKGGRLIDGTGAGPLEDSVILIDDAKITAVGKIGDVDIPEGVEIIDASDKTVMLGLIDAHMHFSGFRLDKYTEETIVTPHGLKLLRASRDAEAILRAG